MRMHAYACAAHVFTQVREDGLRVAWGGVYKVSFGVAEAAAHGMGFVETKTIVA